MRGALGTGILWIDGGVILSRTAKCLPVYDDPMRTTAQLLAEIRADGGLEEFCAAQGIDLFVMRHDHVAVDDGGGRSRGGATLGGALKTG